MTTVHDLAEEAAEAIRAANHATITPGCLTVPDTYRIVGELCALTRRLDQLCHQLDRNLYRRVDAGGLRHDAFGDPIDATVTAAVWLRQAADHSADASRVLDQALNQLSHIADTGDTNR